MQTFINELARILGSYLPNLLAALAILVVGWILALIIAAVVRGVLRRTSLDNRIAQWAAGEERAAEVDVERWISQIVFYVLMLFVLVAFFQTLGLTLITQPLNLLLVQVFEFLPRLLAAGLLLLVAWVLASALRMVVTRALGAAKLDQRLGDEAEVEGQVPLSKTLGDAVYWLVFLLFLPTILDALSLQGLLAPVQELLNEVLGFLPNLLAAGLILLVGWFLARIIQRIVTNLLTSVGVNQLSERIGISSVLGEQQLADLLGFVVYVLVLIPVLIAGLNALALEAITAPAANMLNTFLTAIPAVFGAALVLALAYIVGRLVAGLVTNLLAGIGFNAVLARLGIGRTLDEGQRTPAQIVGWLVLVGVMLFAIIEALQLLGFTVLAAMVANFTTFAGQILLGLIIFALGLYIANLAAQAIRESDVNQSGLLAMAARIAILVLAGAMALRQMGLANEIINLAFGLLLGAIAVAVALAFGLGGRDIAARELEDMVRSVKEDETGPTPGL